MSYLSLLIKNPGRVMDRDQILQALRGMDSDAFNRSVDITNRYGQLPISLGRIPKK